MNEDFKLWIKCAGIRAIKTVAQTALGTLAGCTLFSEVNWLAVGGSALLAGILSLLTSVAGIPEVEYEKARRGVK